MHPSCRPPLLALAEEHRELLCEVIDFLIAVRPMETLADRARSYLSMCSTCRELAQYRADATVFLRTVHRRAEVVRMRRGDTTGTYARVDYWSITDRDIKCERHLVGADRYVYSCLTVCERVKNGNYNYVYVIAKGPITVDESPCWCTANYEDDVLFYYVNADSSRRNYRSSTQVLARFASGPDPQENIPSAQGILRFVPIPTMIHTYTRAKLFTALYLGGLTTATLACIHHVSAYARVVTPHRYWRGYTTKHILSIGPCRGTTCRRKH